MAKWVKAQYDSERKVAEYTDAQGNHLIRSAGSLPWRLNNPGNLRPLMKKGQPAPKAVKTHIGFAKVKNDKGVDCFFLIFPDYETGVNEIRNNLKRLYSKQTIKDAINGYAPPKENNTEKYICDAEKFSGLTRDRVVGKLDSSEFERLVKAIIKIEGYEDQSKGARKVTTVAVSSVTLSDGSKAIAGKTVVLEQDGKTKQVATSETGQLPPIVHQAKSGPVNIKMPDAEGMLKTILSIDMTAEAKHFLLVCEQKIYQAFSGPHASTQTSKQEGRRHVYTVQPGDTLTKIAKKFKTSVDRLQKDNQIKNAKLILAGQRLNICHGNASAPASSTKPAVSTSNAQSGTAKSSAKAPSLSAKAQGQSASTGNDLRKAEVENLGTSRTRSGEGSPAAWMPSDSRRAPWMETAVAEIKKWAGYHESQAAIDIFNKKNEKRGIKSKGLITTNYHKMIGKSGALGNTAWCAAFVNYCLKFGYGADYYEKGDTSQSSQFPVNNKKFMKIDKPVYGAIVVYRHTKKKYGTGHVAFVYAKTDDDDYAVLGGNQSDSITLNKHKEIYLEKLKAKLVGFYVPTVYYKRAQEILAKGDDFGSGMDLKEIKKTLNDVSDVTISTK
ncbi:MAG: LysM peptidoglycan-binding domain-containing protein [Formivibrio sp.]|nr:LysM peptidoglycan-binding domain-containing protein [Formivibrio sp.]